MRAGDDQLPDRKAEYMDDRQDKSRLMKICRASCSMPLLTPIVNVDETPYLDGGLADSVPLKRAQETGNDKIVVILTKTRDTGRKSYPLQCRGYIRRHTNPIRIWYGPYSGEALNIIR